MSKLTLKISLRNGEEKIFPLCLTSQTISKGGNRVSIVTPWLVNFETTYEAIDAFTGLRGTFEIIDYCFVEGCITEETIDSEDDVVLASYRILLNESPVSYEQIQGLKEVSA